MATKYVSSLTGEEMDAALIDMAYHNSEAYAVGTRNGVPVGSSDVTYHNNSKYWAEQVYGYTDRAEDAANRAEAAVPSGTAGAVFFDRAQTLTSAEQEQARANIMAGGSNRNLLDNPWFTVRQRGDGPFTSGYTVDRWQTTSSTTVTINASGTLTWTTSATYREFKQKLANPTYYANGTYTVSVNIVGGTTFPWLIIYDGNGTELLRKSLALGMNVATITTGASGIGQFFIGNLTRTNTDAEFKAVKLELGSVSTLANDTPPDYAEELAKCQFYTEIINAQYGFVIGNGFAVDTTQIRIPIKLAPKRGNLSAVTLTGSMKAGQASASMAVSGVTLNAFDPNTGFCEIRLAVTGATIGQMYKCALDGGSKLLFSAEL